MSALVGVFYAHGRPVPPAQLSRTLPALSLRRDPVEARHWLERSVLLGHALSEVTPEDVYERQPLSDAAGRFRLVATSEIDNRSDLATSYGWSPSAAARLPDSAFILEAFLRWGDTCPDRLEGHFAFLVWDCREQRLFAARDRLGMHPLFVAQGAWGIALASNIKALLTVPEVSHEPDQRALAAHLAGLPRDHLATAYGAIRVVPGGTVLSGRIDDPPGSSVYWQATLPRLRRFKSATDVGDAFHAELRRAVGARLRTQGKVGIMLSGGLDSAVVAMVAANLLAERGKTLTVIHHLPDPLERRQARNRVIDESPFVRAMEHALPNAEFHYLPCRTDVAAPDKWNDYFEQFACPFRGVPSEEWGPEREIRELGVRRLLNGLGGNYIVSWESAPRRYLAYLVSTGRWIRGWQELKRLQRELGQRRRVLVRDHLLASLWPALGRGISAGRQLPRQEFGFVAPEALARLGLNDRSKVDGDRTPISPWRFQEKLLTLMRDVMPQHRGPFAPGQFASAQPISSDAPLLDLRLNQFCLALLPTCNVTQEYDRWLMRNVARCELPPEVSLRITRGFPRPGSRTRLQRIRPALLTELNRLSFNPPEDDIFEFTRVREAVEEVGLDNQLNGARLESLLEFASVAAFLRWRLR